MSFHITHFERERMLDNGRWSRSFPSFDPFPIVKLSDPPGNRIWLLTLIDPLQPDHAAGLFHDGRQEPTLQHFSIAHLRKQQGLQVDRHFRPVAPISAYASAARRLTPVRGSYAPPARCHEDRTGGVQ